MRPRLPSLPGSSSGRRGCCLSPRRLIFGSGFGIPYHDRDKPIDLGAIAEKSTSAFDALCADPHTQGAELSLEIGRYLVGEAGYYLASVVGKKATRHTIARIFFRREDLAVRQVEVLGSDLDFALAGPRALRIWTRRIPALEKTAVFDPSGNIALVTPGELLPARE